MPHCHERPSGVVHNIKMLHFVLFHTATCYINSIVSHIHVNTTKLCNIMCALVATCVILRSLECTHNLYAYSNLASRVSNGCVRSKAANMTRYMAIGKVQFEVVGML